MHKFLRLVAIELVLTLGALSASAINIYDFSSLITTPPTYTSPTTTITSSNNVTATFSSPYDAHNQIPPKAGDPPQTGEFVFEPNGGLYSTLGPYVLSSAGYASLPGNYPAVLDITFSKAQSAVTFDFATTDFLDSNGDVLTLSTNMGQGQTYRALLPASDSYPQAAVAFTSTTPFTSIHMYTVNNAGNNQDLVLADLTSTDAVPEPSTWPMLLGGLGALALFRSRPRGPTLSLFNSTFARPL